MNVILIVEDNEKNLKLLRDVLQYKGYRTFEAMTGAEGLRLAREERPDLVLMDIQLPDIDGITALGRLRADPLTQKTPVVAVSASVMPDVEAREMREMVRAHLMQLEEGPREVLMLHYFSGMSTRQIARTLGISIDAAEKRLQRGKA